MSFGTLTFLLFEFKRIKKNILSSEKKFNLADVKQTSLSYVEKNTTQMEIADFSSANGKGISESLPASCRNGVQQQLIPSTFEKMRSIKRRGSKSTRQIKKDSYFLSLKV